jgi:hypothetical protein
VWAHLYEPDAQAPHIINISLTEAFRQRTNQYNVKTGSEEMAARLKRRLSRD